MSDRKKRLNSPNPLSKSEIRRSIRNSQKNTPFNIWGDNDQFDFPIFNKPKGLLQKHTDLRFCDRPQSAMLGSTPSRLSLGNSIFGTGKKEYRKPTPKEIPNPIKGWPHVDATIDTPRRATGGFCGYFCGWE